MTRRHVGLSIAGATLIGVLASVATIAGRRAATAPGEPVAQGSRVTVVAELFTSEGCSSCPPADALLRTLIATQPIEGVEIIALSEHVDYWDRLGWRDPFSSPAFSARQSAYDAAVFRSNTIYTPQLVVDGASQGVGSDEGVIRRMLRVAARQPRGVITLTVAPTASVVNVTMQLHMPSTVPRTGTADIMLALTEDGLATEVKNGENGGRTLAHSAVVRTLTTVGHLSPHESSMLTASEVPLKAEWRREHLRLVAFAQEQTSRRMLAAATAALSAAGTGTE